MEEVSLLNIKTILILTFDRQVEIRSNSGLLFIPVRRMYNFFGGGDLIDFCAGHMTNKNWSPEQVRTYMKEMLPKLNYWKHLNG